MSLYLKEKFCIYDGNEIGAEGAWATGYLDGVISKGSHFMPMLEHENVELELKDREWDCPICHTHHNRDMNAGENLRRYALTKLAVGTTVKSLEINTVSNISVDC